MTEENTVVENTETPAVTQTENTQETNTTTEPVAENTQTETATSGAVSETQTTTETPIVVQTQNYVKMGQEKRLRLRTLTEAERSSLAMESASMQQQIELKKLERASLISQFNIQIKNIDNEIESLKNTSQDKASKAVVGEFTETITCDVYNTASEILYVEEGKDVTVANNIVARVARGDTQ